MYQGSSRNFDSVVNKKSILIALTLILPASIIIGNILLFNSTKDKIKVFETKPPFLAFDFTNSYLKERDSRIGNLLDGNPTTTWTKVRDSTRKEDFQLELRQTHHLSQGKPRISDWKYLQIKACPETQENLKIDLVLRESIDMDKELRMPKDEIRGELFLEFSKTKHLKIPLKPYYKAEESEEFPQKMFIWTIFGTWKQDHKNQRKKERLCLEDIWLSED
ncbi:hypothetical protein EHO98_00465 [Leptospira stimsonii]|uniref:Uncharacterized protein n=1 Tax=Leptospira stimsonii TaxID=2202203 RepID=A0A4R9L6X5_9LEPT|nr:hypothetical protein [Leptospira stimsonii]RHX93211.1 hypothetical protein DLM75_05720 [Leptospira stimsonii]TGK26409.1 hypothetical protein EHO98_00465 [Leptospira stimsonii]TGM20250.1 hypothetical protein EHQ90_03810 [Leptospira stimsonii]